MLGYNDFAVKSRCLDEEYDFDAVQESGKIQIAAQVAQGNSNTKEFV